MNARRGLPEDEPFASDETELEMSAVRRGLWLDDLQDPRIPRRASRAADDEPDLSTVDLQPSQPASGTKAKPDKPSPAKANPAKTGPPKNEHARTTAGKTKPEKPESAATGLSPRTRLAATIAARTPGLSQEFSTDQRWRNAVVGAALLGLAVSFGIGAMPAQQASLPATVPLVTAISRICPATDTVGSTLLAVSSSGDIRTRVITQTEPKIQASPLTLPAQSEPVVITPTEAQSSVTGGSLLFVGEQVWWGRCRSPLADQYVHLPGGADARLVIVNAEPDPALIDVTLSGPSGEITGEGLRGVTVEANSTLSIDLARFAADVDALGARVRSSVGRVTAFAQVARPSGGDFATSTEQSTALVIPAIPADATKTQVLLTNPGTTRNVVTIEAVGEAGRFVLPGFESYALNAQRTVAVDLTEAIGGVPVALLISGRDAFSATAVVSVGNDFGIEDAQVDDQSIARQDLVGVVPGSGTLQVANPGNGEALIVVDWGPGQALANRTIAPGSVVTVDVPAGAQSARVTSTAPVAAAIMFRSGSQPGFAIAQLHPRARSQASMPMEVKPGMGR